jgi:hypothetical protein
LASQSWVSLNEPLDIEQVFAAFAGASLGVLRGPDFAG